MLISGSAIAYRSEEFLTERFEVLRQSNIGYIEASGVRHTGADSVSTAWHKQCEEVIDPAKRIRKTIL